MLALLYDIHGNPAALEAVLGDARAAGASRFLLGGDYGLFGPCPSEVIATLKALPEATWIRGNVDRWGGQPDQAGGDELLQRAIADYRTAVGVDVATELCALDEHVVLDGTRYCHASPRSDLESFLPSPSDDDEELLAGAGERRVVFGHTHLQFRRPGPEGVELVNPGSVGMPLDGDPRAAYALVSDGGELELRRVGYDRERMIAALSDADWAQRTARRLRDAKP
jgi:diadenosine tetraphosphatase ApaH/serine/threonine PP2A family protein phosphatase